MPMDRRVDETETKSIQEVNGALIFWRNFFLSLSFSFDFD
jgi:hypothetical protein